MPFTLTMPKLSPTMESGMIVKWHKKEGERARAGDLLIEVATDKATVEFNAIDEGWLRRILIPENKEATINQPIAIFTEKQEESIEGYQPEGVQASSAPIPAPLGLDLNEGWTTEQETEPPLQVEAVVAPAPPSSHTDETNQSRLLASPLAKKLAKERGVPLEHLTGSGPSGRIMARDLDKAAPTKHSQQIKLPAGSLEMETLTPMRRVIAQRLQEAKNTIPHFYIAQEMDGQPLAELREQLRQHEIKFSINDLIIRATALALRQHPAVNSGFDPAKQALIRFKTIDIAVAVSVKSGLITPIISHADQKNLSQISTEVRQLAERAKEGKLAPQEYQGGSFTISNLGMFQITQFAAILNPPQAAILAVGGLQDVPVVKQGQVVPGKRLILTLSVDHRVIDGVAAAEFMQSLQKLIEFPAALLV